MPLHSFRLHPCTSPGTFPAGACRAELPLRISRDSTIGVPPSIVAHRPRLPACPSVTDPTFLFPEDHARRPCPPASRVSKAFISFLPCSGRSPTLLPRWNSAVLFGPVQCGMGPSYPLGCSSAAPPPPLTVMSLRRIAPGSRSQCLIARRGNRHGWDRRPLGGTPPHCQVRETGAPTRARAAPAQGSAQGTLVIFTSAQGRGTHHPPR